MRGHLYGTQGGGVVKWSEDELWWVWVIPPDFAAYATVGSRMNDHWGLGGRCHTMIELHREDGSSVVLDFESGAIYAGHKSKPQHVKVYELVGDRMVHTRNILNDKGLGEFYDLVPKDDYDTFSIFAYCFYDEPANDIDHLDDDEAQAECEKRWYENPKLDRNPEYDGPQGVFAGYGEHDDYVEVPEPKREVFDGYGEFDDDPEEDAEIRGRERGRRHRGRLVECQWKM